MNLESKINNDLKEAMKNKDQAALRSIRAIKAAILLFKTDGSGNELDTASEIKLLQKLVKQRQDSLDIYEKQDREDLAVTEKEEIAVGDARIGRIYGGSDEVQKNVIAKMVLGL